MIYVLLIIFFKCGIILQTITLPPHIPTLLPYCNADLNPIIEHILRRSLAVLKLSHNGTKHIPFSKKKKKFSTKHPLSYNDGVMDHTWQILKTHSQIHTDRQFLPFKQLPIFQTTGSWHGHKPKKNQYQLPTKWRLIDS